MPCGWCGGSAAWLAELPAAITGVRLDGEGEPATRLAQFARELADHERAPVIDVALVMLGAREVTAGARREFVAGPPRPVTSGPQARITVRFSHSEPTFQDFDRDPGIGRGAGRQPGLDRIEIIPGRPITVPALDYAGVRTSVAVPAGGAGRGGGVVGTGAPNVRVGMSDPVPDMVRDRFPHPRSPELAFAAYREAMVEFAGRHLDLTLVWITLPLATSENALRHRYNDLVRGHVKAKGGMLLDVADLLAVDASGRPCADDQDPILASDWADPRRGCEGRLNQAGRQRLVAAFAELLARM